MRREIDDRIESARLTRDGDTLDVGASSWTQSTEATPRPTGEPCLSPCASVGATLEKRGDIVRDPREDVPTIPGD